MIKRSTLLLCFLTFGIFQALADTGCAYNGNVYTRSPYFNNIFDFNIYWSVPLQDNCPLGSLQTTQYANISIISGTTCNVGFFQAGVEVTYQVDFCPLDDLIWIMIFPACFWSYRIARDRKTTSLLN
ncbi:hypothetical protein DBR40_17015 [Pedobacter sp. KBW01]|nr:hypothetical protein DBR40_17015 [Pedobacter sp. KBW01]